MLGKMLGKISCIVLDLLLGEILLGIYVRELTYLLHYNALLCACVCIVSVI